MYARSIAAPHSLHLASWGQPSTAYRLDNLKGHEMRDCHKVAGEKEKRLREGRT